MTEIIQTYTNILEAYLKVHVSLAPLISIFLRIISIMFAPVPGTPIDLMNLALFSKKAGFIYAEIGIMIGSSINFYIGRKFGEPVVKKFIDIGKIHIWEERLNVAAGFWGLVFIRVSTILICDYISYVAGLTKMSFGKFFTTTLVASLPIVAAFYYFGGILIQKQLFLVIILIMPFIILFYLFQKGKIFRKFHDYLDIKSHMEKINDFIKRDSKVD